VCVCVCVCVCVFFNKYKKNINIEKNIIICHIVLKNINILQIYQYNINIYFRLLGLGRSQVGFDNIHILSITYWVR